MQVFGKSDKKSMLFKTHSDTHASRFSSKQEVSSTPTAFSFPLRTQGGNEGSSLRAVLDQQFNLSALNKMCPACNFKEKNLWWMSKQTNIFGIAPVFNI